ncbi:hypothetical protein Rfer_2838 [Rhodoferax ferrireducens T118]|uniref:Uncharacterized protein n=1 Tax=Albidiferax ferrireducens (strain ATCC BAA-621 / DSM 15236 / T118) TaxID=338969 RepID=Q21UK3_ALBFT|nr:hypothetical protein [Rhodoferax ferrireducens]ABD70550.1 hypothetical protein Rfer_2838 [Rhodoferax ferrireducens T118]
MNKQTLPPSVRRAINRKAHELALVQERRIKAELIAQAIASQDCVAAGDDGLCGMRPLTDVELAALFKPFDLNELFKPGEDALSDFRKPHDKTD